MQERVLFRRIHGQVILTRAARIDELQNNVFADAFQVPPPPGFPRISARRAAALFHRPVVRAARGVRFHFIRRAPHDVHAAAIGLPSRDARPIAAACTSCGARRMKWNRTPRAARTTGRWKRAAARRALIRGKPGGGGTWKASAKTLFWSSSIRAALVSIT